MRISVQKLKKNKVSQKEKRGDLFEIWRRPLLIHLPFEIKVLINVSNLLHFLSFFYFFIYFLLFFSHDRYPFSFDKKTSDKKKDKIVTV